MKLKVRMCHPSTPRLYIQGAKCWVEKEATEVDVDEWGAKVLRSHTFVEVLDAEAPVAAKAEQSETNGSKGPVDFVGVPEVKKEAPVVRRKKRKREE